MNSRSREPYTIRIFAQGNPDGLKVIWPSNWSGRGSAFPRTAFPDIKKNKEFAFAGVYVLVGPSEDAHIDTPQIYIGEADEIRSRLETHVAQLDFWTWCIFFVSNDGSLNKANAKYIEHKLFTLAKQVDRAVLDQNVPQDVALSESDEADAESFLAEMLDIFPVVGLTAFQLAPTRTPEEEYLSLTGRGITARGFESNQGFVVVAGSHAALDETDALRAQVSQLRRQLRDRDLLVSDGENLKLTKNYVFNSPSQAATVFLAMPANGLKNWKDKNGTTLKELQESATPQD